MGLDVWRHQPMADDRVLSLYALAGCLVPKYAGLPVDRHAVPVAGYTDVHGLVLLGIPRKGSRRHRLSLRKIHAGRRRR